MNAAIRTAIALAIVSTGLLFAQTSPPAFDQYPVKAPKFPGKPAPPVIKTAEHRRFRTMIREGAATGPNFAGHFTLVEWGCGAGCVSTVIVNAVDGAVHDGPFKTLDWQLRKYEDRYASNDDRFEQLAYRLDSRLLVARGCLAEGDCASFFWEWTGSQFKLIRKIPSAPLPQATAAPPNLFDAHEQVDEYIRSGRYEQDFAKVADAARAWLEERAKTAVKPAIVLDIDETSLSNWPAYRLNGWGRVVNGGCDLEQGPCGLRAWQALGQSKALPGTLALARRARELGVAVFFISARPAEIRAATERNLKEQGYEWTGLTILPEGAHIKSAVDFKAPERRRIADQGYTILLSLGDQESDLKGGFAERTFKLPNPVYFLP